MAIAVYAGDIGNVVWTTDKVRISTGDNPVQIMIRTSGKPNSNDDRTFEPDLPIIPSNSSMDMYVGVGNKLTIIGGNSTAMAIGTASSGDAGVYQN